MDNSYGSADERSLCDCNCYYWTIVTAVSARYCCTSAEQVRQLYTFMQQSHFSVKKSQSC
ncbi:MAG: hypothetical protein SWX82_26830 [Cyanobacteriota bacterium]|nr:hypothetical protein [Cyanobacteriota bacterium]